MKIKLITGALFVGSCVVMPTAMAVEVSDWTLGLNFSFSSENAPGGISQDPLTLTVGVSSAQPASKLKPPLPPGLAKTNNAGYPLVDAYVKEGGQRVFNKLATADSGHRAAYGVKVRAEKANAKVTVSADCANLDKGITVTLIHARTKKKESFSKNSCSGNVITFTDFVEVADPNVPEDLFIVGAPDGGGFVAKTEDGTVIGSLTSDNAAKDFTGTTVSIGGTPVTLDANGLFTGPSLSGVQQVLVERPRHLRKRVDFDLDSGSPLVLPKLMGGDTNGDNKIDFTDVLKLKKDYDTDATCYTQPVEVACADINGDGKIDFSDVLLMKANYDQTGDP